MKKLFALMLSLAMAVSLAACGAKPLTAEEVYTKAEEKSAAMEKVDADMTIDMTMELAAEGETQTIDMTVGASMRGENVGKEGMRFEMPMSVSMPMLGMSMNVNSYYADGYYMMDMMGTKIKTPMDLDRAIEQIQSSGMAELGSVDLLKDLAMTEVESEDKKKQYQLTYTMDPEALGGFYDEYLGSMGLGDESQITWGDIAGTLLVDKEFNIVNQTMTADFSMTVEGETVSCSMAMDAVYKTIDEDFALNIPDASEYEEVDASVMGVEDAA